MKRRNFIGYTLLLITSCSGTTNNTISEKECYIRWGGEVWSVWSVWG
ncbi:MAG: hypothetical protein F6K22_19560 [Okeania sp. SIO2F4]|nr:hypothetical protein [Okeania sp. SIO2F4]NES04836.1 hypothetical protein [Okeania sp. SIO2F4]